MSKQVVWISQLLADNVECRVHCNKLILMWHTFNVFQCYRENGVLRKVLTVDKRRDMWILHQKPGVTSFWIQSEIVFSRRTRREWSWFWALYLCMRGLCRQWTTLSKYVDVRVKSQMPPIYVINSQGSQTMLSTTRWHACYIVICWLSQ